LEIRMVMAVIGFQLLHRHSKAARSLPHVDPACISQVAAV
jgi:hypothetical protein